MHKTTFNALDRKFDFYGRVATCWDGGDHHGQTCTIANLVQPRSVVVVFKDKTRATVDHRKIALGDNSLKPGETE